MANLENHAYLTAVSGRGYIGTSDHRTELSGGGKYKGEAGKHKVVVIFSKAARASAFPANTKSKDIFYVGTTAAEVTLANGDTGALYEVTDDFPLISATINQTGQIQENLTQVDNGQSKKTFTGQVETEISVTIQPRKGDAIVTQLNNPFLRTMSTAANGTITVQDKKREKFLLFLKSLDDQTDEDVGVACVATVNNTTYNVSIEEASTLEIPMSIDATANLTKIIVKK